MLTNLKRQAMESTHNPVKCKLLGRQSCMSGLYSSPGEHQTIPGAKNLFLHPTYNATCITKSTNAEKVYFGTIKAETNFVIMGLTLACT